MLDVRKISWVRKDTRSYASTLFSSMHMFGYINNYPKFVGSRLHKVMFEGKNFIWYRYLEPSDVKQFEEHIRSKIEEENFVGGFLKKLEGAYKEADAFYKQMLGIDFSEVDDSSLFESFDSYFNKTIFMTSGQSASIWVTNAYVEKTFSKRKLTEKEKQLLARPLHGIDVVAEEKQFLGLVGRAQHNNLKKFENFDSQLKKEFEAHFKKWCWLSAYVAGETWRQEQFVKRVDSALAASDADEQLRKINNEKEKVEREITALIKAKKISKEEVFNLRSLIHYRMLAETRMGLANYSSQKLFEEIAKRKNIPENLLELYTFKEIREDVPLSELQKRKRHYIVLMGKDDFYFFSGKDADNLSKEISFSQSVEKEVGETKKLGGTPASPGFARGRVKIILTPTPAELSKVKIGDVMVVPNTTPMFLPAMKRAVAIVTDEGGLTCHAAIVSRELGIPCVVGTKVATKVLRDGDEVEVNADKGVVKKIPQKVF